MISRTNSFIFVFIILALNACSTTPPIQLQATGSSDDLFKSCLSFYEEVEAKIQLFDAQDAQTLAIPGYPFLLARMTPSDPRRTIY